jgi:hypothetical protein
LKFVTPGYSRAVSRLTLSGSSVSVSRTYVVRSSSTPVTCVIKA